MLSAMGLRRKLSMSGVRVCFDVGSVRVGVAKCDRDQILAVPVLTLTNDESLVSAATRVILDIEPGAIYVGLPINLKGQVTASTQAALNFAEALSLDLRKVSFVGEIRLIDERLSTASALSSLRDSGRTTKDSRGIVDQVAAVEILEFAMSLEKHTGELAGAQLANHNQ